jgi:two-component system, NtrC family, sensor histidine kinase AtoS
MNIPHATLHAGPPILSMRGIRVSYGSTLALRGADFDLYREEIHALVGAHRAGKSTLVKLLSGAVRKDSGEIVLDGRRVDSFTPKSAMKNGIGIVYQHLNVIPSLSAAENIFAGRMIKSSLFVIGHRKMSEQARALFAGLEFPIDVDVPVNRLTVAEQHMVELARVLSFEPRILILDEVSSKLTPEEMERIYPLLLRLREQGRSVIYISHNMDEIFQFANRVTILKEGLRMDTERIADLERVKLIKLTYSFVLSREELGRQNLELYGLKRYNENIIKNIPVGVIILNAEHRIYLINYAAVKILQLDSESVGRPFAELVTQDELPDRPLIMQKIEAREELLLDEAAYGERKILKVSLFPFRDDDDSSFGTIILMEDVSRARYLDDYLLRAEKISSTAELAAGVAHEINNPLGIVQNYIELLKLKELDADARVKLTKIENEVTRIEKIIGSLLSFSKFTEVSFHDVDLAEMLEEVILLLAHRLTEKNIVVTRETRRGRAIILGDENKLKQLFINLFANSIEAVAQGGTIGAEFAVDEEAKTAEIAITDNGCGIPAEIAGRIYDPFFSTKKSKKNAGLGLSISQRIVELHNGMISCTSQPGRSTRFSVRFPLAISAAQGAIAGG